MTLIRYRRTALVTTVGICLLVVAGGIVRLTGSGLGCDDWPNCNSERFIDVSSGHAAIEQLNRLLSGFIGIPTLLLVLFAFRAAPRGAGLRWPAIGVLVSILGNGVVGGFAVLGDLHPALVQSHFLLAMTSIAFAMIAFRAGTGVPIRWNGLRPIDATSRLLLALAGFTALAVVTGTVVTGAGPHAGDEDVRRYGFDIGDAARVHSATVLAAVGIAIVLASLYARRRSEIGSELSTWLFVAIVQGAIGYTQYFTDVPAVLVGAHIAGATLLWVTTVRLLLQVNDVRAPDATRSGHAPETQSLFDSSAARV